MRGLEQARYQARRSFRRRIAEKETQNPAVIAKVGNGAGTVVVPGRPGWIYVRLHGDDNQLTEAKLGIPLDTGSLDDAWVRVKRASARKTSYYALQEFITSSTGDPTPPMSAHPLDPDAGPHTGTLPEDDVAFDDGAGHDHQGAGDTGKKVDYTDLANKEHAPTHKSGGGDEVDVKDLPDSEGRLLTGVQKTDLTDEGLTTLHRHAGGATSSVLITLTNRTGGQRESGDVVVVDVSSDESFTGTDQVGHVGKVFVVAETIADLTGGQVWERGGPFDAKVTGTVGRNDGLRTSATIYRAQAAPSLTAAGVFAVALSPNISGEGTVKAVFLDAIGGGGGGGTTIEIQEDDVKVADADVVNFEGGGGKVTDEGGGKVTVDITPGGGGNGKGVIWVYPAGITADMHPFLDNIGDFATRPAAQDVDVFFNFAIPSDFSSLNKAVAVFIAVNADNSTFDLASDFGADGEDYNNHSEGETTGAYNFAINKLVEVDVSGVLSAIAAGDYAGLTVDKNSATALLKWIGLKIEYTKA